MNEEQSIMDLIGDENLTDEQAAAVASLAEEAAAQEAKNAELRDKLGQVLVKRRDDAVKFRVGSGIERQWAEDQAYYEGEDETGRSLYYKGLTMDSPMIAKPDKSSAFKSKVFLNITRPYVETASSKVIEVLSPVDDRAFSLKPSPIPFALLEGRVIEGQAIPPLPVAPMAGEAPPQPGMLEQAGAPPMAGQGAPTMINQAGQPATPGEVGQENDYEADMELVRQAAKGAETWIDDALQKCGYNSELRSLVDESARLGTGIMRGPLPTMRMSRKATEDGYIVVEEVVPTSKNISVWGAYPDPACGDDIHNGQFFIEHDMMVEKQVRDLTLLPGYVPEAIEKVIQEGPSRSNAIMGLMPPHLSLDTSAKRFDVWYYYGILSADDVVAMGCECGEIEGGVPAVVTMINDTPVKAHLNPMSSGRFPYDFMRWQRTAGSPWGIGIARQIRACQSILNATVRSMMENAGLSSGPQVILGRGAIIPADGKWEVTPRKIWLLKPDADIPDVSKAFNAILIPSNQQELLMAVEFALKMAENVTGLPILLQGQQGPSGVPETVGGMQILVANASSLLRRMARIFDDSITKPHVTAYYDWMMEFGEDDKIKGDFQVIPRGASALVAKDMRATFLMSAVPQFLANPGFGIDPTRYFKEVAKLNGLEAADIQFSKAEMAALMEQGTPLEGRVQAAQIAAEARIEAEKIQARTDLARIQRDQDRDTIYVQAENERTQVTSATKQAELELRRELAMLEFANKHQLTIEQIKAKLAIDGAKMDLQRELSVMGRITPEDVASGTPGEVITPPVEPPGKAPDGKAFVA
jgi:hypothetical protein